MAAPQSSPEKHHWELAAVVVPLVTGGLFALVAVARATALPWWYVSVAVLLMSAVGVFTVAVVTANLWSIGHSVVTSIVVTAWSTVAVLAGPWHLATIFALVVSALVLGPLYPVVIGHHRAVEAAAARRKAEARQQDEARKLEQMFERLGAKGVTVAGAQETTAGHVYRLTLPKNGKVKYKKLVGLAESVEIIRALRDGAVRFERGDHAGDVLMYVSEKDILAQVVPYNTEDLSDLTVNRPFRIGLNEDGTPRLILFREVAVLIVGLRGSGKSNLLNVLIAQLGRCVDVVIWMIDLKGGRAARPWLQPWFDGKARRPVIDWAATTRDEAERMIAAALRGVDARSYGEGEKVIPSGRQPAFCIIVDEMAVIFGSHTGRTSDGSASNSQLSDMMTTFVQLSRSEAFDGVLATQRGTVTMTGGGDLKSQCKLRVGLGVASEADARLIVPDDAQVARLLPKLKHPGSGIVSDHDTLGPVKFDRIEPSDIYALAEQLGDERRPAPEPALAAALGADYDQRWTDARAGHIPGFRRGMAARGQLGNADQSTIDREYASMMAEAGLAGDDLDDEDEDRRNPDRERMVEIVCASGVMGITPRTLAAKLEGQGIQVARGTIQRWLNEEAGGSPPRLESASYGRWRRAQPRTGG